MIFDNYIIKTEDSCMLFVEGGGFLFVARDGRTVDHFGQERVVYEWRILGLDASLVDRSPGDLLQPNTEDESPAKAMRAFISFLLACAEAPDEGSDNYLLFEPTTREWAEMVSDELSMLIASEEDWM